MKTSDQRTIHKFTHNWLPTGHQMQKRYHVKNQCPFCSQPENNLHLIDCEHHTEQKQAFLQKLQLILHHNKTNKTLANLILCALNGEKLKPPKHKQPQHAWTCQLIQEQNQIGSKQMWLGHITQTWGDIQEQEYRNTGQDSGYTGTRWTRIIIQQIFKYVIQCWNQRNQKIHQQLQQPAPYREAIQQAISNLYKKYHKTPEVFPSLFKHKLENLIKKPMRYLLRWYNLMKPMEEYAKQQRKHRMGADIRKYLKMQEKPPETQTDRRETEPETK